MTDRSSRDRQYVLTRDQKPKRTTRYYYENEDDEDDDDDDDDYQTARATRRIVRTKPPRAQHVKYITSDELDTHYRRQGVVEPRDRGMKIVKTTNGEQMILDEEGNAIKIIRNSRSPSPPYVENRRMKPRLHQSQTLYYETADGRLVPHPSKSHRIQQSKHDFVYAEDEPTKVLRKIIVDPRTGDQETVYEKEKPKTQSQHQYTIQKRMIAMPNDSDDDHHRSSRHRQQPKYVQVVQKKPVPTKTVIKQEAPVKYVMIRRKMDSEPIYTPAASIPTNQNNRRIVYETPAQKASTYVYATDGKYYK